MNKSSAVVRSEIPETKLRILTQGIALMRVKGFNATTVADICEAAGVTKGGFFHYFANKEDLTKEAILFYRQETQAAYQAAGFLDLPDPLDRFVGRLEFMKGSRPDDDIWSCLIGTLAQEIAMTHPELRVVLKATLSKMAADLEADLAAAKSLRAPDAAFDPAALASMFLSMFQGSLILSKATGDNEVVVRNIDGFRAILDCFFSRSAAKAR